MNFTSLRALYSLLLLLAVIASVEPQAFAKSDSASVTFPAGVRHDAWDALLKKYVNENGLVAYEKWKASESDRKTLDDYLAQFAPRPETPAKGDDLTASAINAYNAFAIRWILQHYPTESIQAINGSFKTKAHEIGGAKVSLDDIEHRTLRPLIGWRAHAALVCCARSCPPLRRTAYTPAGLNAQIDAAYTAWLAREDLNQFQPKTKRAAVSSIFRWFQDDFAAGGGVQRILAQYAPPADREFLKQGDFKLEYLPYRWGLNDQGGHGENYSRTNMLFDAIFK